MKVCNTIYVAGISSFWVSIQARSEHFAAAQLCWLNALKVKYCLRPVLHCKPASSAGITLFLIATRAGSISAGGLKGLKIATWSVQTLLVAKRESHGFGTTGRSMENGDCIFVSHR